MIARTSVVVRRPPADVLRFVTEPADLLPHMTGLGRFRHHEGDQWDAFLDVGTIHVGGRIVIERGADRIEWQSVRGTRHRFRLVVVPEGDHARLDLTMDFHLAGLMLSRVAELVGRGVAQRHLEAGAQELRHHLEYELPE